MNYKMMGMEVSERVVKDFLHNIFSIKIDGSRNKKIIKICGIKLGSYRPKKTIKLFREMGVKIGEVTRIISPPNFGKIKIGNNCFVGCNVTILPNVIIWNDCIIGAGSIVTKMFLMVKFGLAILQNV